MRKRIRKQPARNAAGIDIGAEEIYVAADPDRDAEPLRRFSSLTVDLKRLAARLLELGGTTFDGQIGPPTSWAPDRIARSCTRSRSPTGSTLSLSPSLADGLRA